MNNKFFNFEMMKRIKNRIIILKDKYKIPFIYFNLFLSAFVAVSSIVLIIFGILYYLITGKSL
jgi:hypothetical protein